ncbi:MAG: hypothetical protein A2427_03755 [Candidatus Nealsonbacteria bacterium RIFOXYC1_FULL_40_7]|uniref:Uncharacterized protein n=1 Tax=Candidatus Nealsonbacteria bacterium RIFOXYC1_FULL_40_7 TaxID=1801678 RepID=A0A1G2EUA2_9BACT|nr:MAG: hypothetical protein A2427_03755 [Candidatus Nealsonbacteria bacterium RIFOXYC1_FULL_40_7]
MQYSSASTISMIFPIKLWAFLKLIKALCFLFGFIVVASTFVFFSSAMITVFILGFPGITFAMF